MIMQADSEAASKEEEFTMKSGVLRANIDLYWEYLEEFDAACNKLLDSRRDVVELDLSSVNFISSSYVGCLSSLLLGAAKRKKRVNLKVSEDISWLFEILGSREVLDLEVV